MSAICRHLAAPCALTTGFRVARVESDGHQSALVADDGRREAGFDAVMVAAPAPQSAEMIRSLSPSFATLADAVPFSACLALLVAFDRPLDLGFDGAFVDGSALSWLAVNGSKPGRSGEASVVLHGSPDWSDENFGADEDLVVQVLCQAFTEATGVAVGVPVYSHLHRWRYALPTEPLSDRFLFDASTGIGVCGDWCGGPRVEGAYLSGVTLAERVLKWLNDGGA